MKWILIFEEHRRKIWYSLIMERVSNGWPISLQGAPRLQYISYGGYNVCVITIQWKQEHRHGIEHIQMYRWYPNDAFIEWQMDFHVKWLCIVCLCIRILFHPYIAEEAIFLIEYLKYINIYAYDVYKNCRYNNNECDIKEKVSPSQAMLMVSFNGTHIHAASHLTK